MVDGHCPPLRCGDPGLYQTKPVGVWYRADCDKSVRAAYYSSVGALHLNTVKLCVLNPLNGFGSRSLMQLDAARDK